MAYYSQILWKRRTIKKKVFYVKRKLGGSKIIIREDLTRGLYDVTTTYILRKVNYKNVFTF